MCGITGILNLQQARPISIEQLKLMTSIIRHRGPDEIGVYIDDWMGMGHARLSIIDLVGGTQPIHNEDQTLWIIFNGEIYNYPELRAELVKDGHTFYTSSDTEVILHLFEKKGAACVEDLNGQFAIAIWDSNKKELFLARDRVGIRPLFYTVYDNQLFFSSEIKSIFTNKQIPREIDPKALDHVFTFWTTLAGKTIFRDIFEVPPGHILQTSENGISIKKYWDIPFFTPTQHYQKSTDDLVAEIKDLLLDATRIRLRADVPVGTYLSGGLDSSGITALVKKNFNNQLHTFGIRFEEKDFDEGNFQEYMVSYLKTDHSEVIVSNKQIGDVFADVLWHCEKPLMRTAPIPLYLLSDLVRQKGFKVVLTGEGADEIFAGYNIFREAKLRQFWAKQPNSTLRPLLLARLYPYILKDSKLKFTLKSFFGDQIEQSADPFFSHHIRWKNTVRLKTFYSSELKHQLGEYDGLDILRDSLPTDFNEWDYLSKAQYLEMAIFLSNYLLSSQGDRVAMANSLEIRLPYLDYRLINLMGHVAAKQKMEVLDEKSLLKKSFRGIVPEMIINRPKNPYRAPIKQSLMNGNISLLKEIQSSDALKEVRLFDSHKTEKLTDKLVKFQRASEFDSMALTGILSTQIIYDQFVKNFPYKPIQDISIDLFIDRRQL